MWLPDDTDAALAYMEYLAEQNAKRCPRCGTTDDDWIDPETGRDLRDPIWRTEVRHCEGCATITDAEEDIAEGERATNHVVLVPNLGDDEDEWLHPVDAEAET